MELFGYEIALRKKAAPVSASAVPAHSFQWGLWPSMWRGIREANPGDWQRNITTDPETSILAFSAVYACVSGIAADVAKMRIKLSRDVDGIWQEITKESQLSGEGTSPVWLNLVRKPNHYQTRIQFIEQWIISKLLYGNTYVWKERESGPRGLVRRLYVLHPQRVIPMVAEDGSVWYGLRRDDLSQLPKDLTELNAVPASEIIHDRGPCLWHPLVGVPPIYACGRSATMGNKIQLNSTDLFGNRSIPGGIVKFPVTVDDKIAEKFKERWEQNFGGANRGRTAILDNGATFEAITMPAEQMQLIEQLKWTVEDVGRAFRYPTWKMGGPNPTYAQSPEAISVVYYTDCLQQYVESVELCMEEGIELKQGLHIELDLDGLMRMDTGALHDSINKTERWAKLDEQRFRANLPPLPIGGDTVYRQEQDHSIEWIAERDKQGPPPRVTPPALPPAPPEEPETPPDEPEDEERGFLVEAYVDVELRKEMSLR